MRFANYRAEVYSSAFCSRWSSIPCLQESPLDALAFRSRCRSLVTRDRNFFSASSLCACGREKAAHHRRYLYLSRTSRNDSAPQFVEWSPDGRRLSLVRANSTDGRDELYSLDPATGHGSVLIGAGLLASLMAPSAKLSEREHENRARYGVAAYLWAPDSRGLLFDASGQLRFYDLETGKATDLTGPASPVSRSQVFPDGRYISFLRDHDLVLRRLASGQETKLTNSSPSVWNGEADWVYQEELDVRSNYFWAPDASHIAYLQMDESAVPEYPIVDWLSRDAGIDRQRYPKGG